jgi:hypothetical protein
MLGDWLEHHMGAITAVIAIAAIAQWRETRKTSQRQLRAYVGVTTGTVIFEVSENKIMAKATIRIKNYGQTPAYGVGSTACIEAATEFTEEMNDRQKPINGKGAIFPQDSQRIIFPGEIALFSDDPVGIFIFGRITYRDSFGHSRWTNFRFTARVHPSLSRADLVPEAEGNDAN